MECYTICQSCGMPLTTDESFGTEKGLSKSTLYCIHCYQNGEYVQPNLTLADMKAHIQSVMQKEGCKEADIVQVVNRLPFLLRWLGIPVIHHTCEYH